jgi:ATP-dependent RNA helicase DDX56/DBP9
LLKHDKVLSKRQPLPHLNSIPEYMRDPSTEAASKTLKLARAAMGQVSGMKRKRRGKMDDPLRTFSANVSYRPPLFFLLSTKQICPCRGPITQHR